jgi:predicted transposase/invertase (TIGR01784 family)
MVFRAIGDSHPVDIQTANQQGRVVFGDENIFPERFFISIPLFDEVIHQEIDEWLYMMKHCEVRDDFKSPYMKKIKERLAVLNMSAPDRTAYYNYLKEAVYSQNVLMATQQKSEARGIEKGVEQGRSEGERSTLVRIAHTKQSQGLSVGQIADLLDLSTEKVNDLLSQKQ